MNTTPRGLYLKLTLVALLWGGIYIAGRQLAATLPVMVAAALRYAVAAVALLVFMFWREGRVPRLDAWQWRRVALLGATGVFAYSGFFFAALAQIPASRVALIIATNPAWTALGAWLLMRARLRPLQGVGVALALAGSAVVISGGSLAGLGDRVSVGDAMSLAAAISWAAYTLLGRDLLVRGAEPPSPLAVTALAAAVGGVALVLASLPQWPLVRLEALNWGAAVAALYVGVFGTALAFVWYYDAVRAIGAARTAVFNNLVPVCAVLLAALLLAEPIEAPMVLGGLVTIAGVWLTNKES